ncbi:hypothetical protein V8E36_006132 [Tilletia maclaganii]
MERYFGELQGKVWKGGDRNGVPGIEPVERVTERLAGFWNDVILSPGPWQDVVDEEDGQDEGGEGAVAASARPGEIVRTILLVGHGSALSTLAGLVLLDGGHVELAPGAERGRIWNCSITEIHVPASPARSALSSASSSSQSSPQKQKKLSRRFKSLGSHFLPQSSPRWLVRPAHLSPLSASHKSPQALRTAPSTFTWPDGTPLGNIGYGPGRGVITRWADVAHIKAMAAASGNAGAANLVKNVDEMVENPSAPVSGTATPAAVVAPGGAGSSQQTQPDQPTIPITIEFGGGTELITHTPEQKVHHVQIPSHPNGRPADARALIHWISTNLIAERHELFLEGDTVRPGILVLINDADWELEGEGDYVLQSGDRLVFISTLHGG